MFKTLEHIQGENAMFIWSLVLIDAAVTAYAVTHTESGDN